jgi:glucan 1,3-beta-glucosidase
MLLDLQKVLSALGLVSSIAKPIPLVGGVASGLIDSAGGLLNSTAGSSTSPLGGLLGGGLLAQNVTGNATDLTAADTNQASTSSVDIPSCAIQPYTPATVNLESFPPYDAASALIYRYRQQQSVNLGSWFVQEQWMNPSLFSCASGNKQAELDVASGWAGVDNARQVLERHWDEWITESDFAYLASIGTAHTWHS